MSKLKFFTFASLCLFFATCLKDNQDNTVTLESLTRKYVGKKGLLKIYAYPTYEFEEDTKMNTHFKAKISDRKNIANIIDVNCGFWKLSGNTLYVFCKIDTDIPAGNYSIDFSGIQPFNYQKYNVHISNSKFDFEKLDKDLIDLYSKEQTINIQESIESYEVKFNIFSYNHEALVLETFGLVFMSCRQDNNELICQLKKDDLLKDLSDTSSKLSVCYIDYTANSGYSKLPLVGRITVIYNTVQKTDVFVGITKLLENVAEGDSSFALETNVTNIKQVLTIPDNLNFDIFNENKNTNAFCSFRKDYNNPLLIICFANNEIKDDFSLTDLEKEIIVDKSNVKYTFRVQPFKIKEKIYYSSKYNGTNIMHILPEMLDFTKNENLNVYYSAERVAKLKGITFNKDKGDLSCEIINGGLYRCNVPKTHFDKNGYYITKHTNHLNTKSTFYESRPIKVVLSVVSSANYYSISLYYLLLLILIMF